MLELPLVDIAGKINQLLAVKFFKYVQYNSQYNK